MSQPSRKAAAVERISGEFRPLDILVVLLILAILGVVILTTILD
jgi:hypothetical protein